jgi:Matrixin
MPNLRLNVDRRPVSQVRRRAVRPGVEGLEARLLLYAATGDQWTYDSRITYSFMPDGTSVGGVSSVLFQTLNANYATTTWEQQIETAASLWENVSNINLALVSDGGEPDGTNGDQQDDPRFGDIRIGAVPLPSGVLAETFLPPPANGGTDAGDILLNSNVNWQINSNYDLQTVVAHEFGHALGLGDSSVSTAVMYGTYTGIKQALASDDIAGIQSIYGARQFDQFNVGGHRDTSFLTATNINSYITGNAQIAIPNLDITTTGDSEWFYVNVPSSTTGTMTVTVQSSNLSSLSPSLAVYSSSLSLVGQASAPSSLGATVSVSTSVVAGQGYYFKVLAAGGPGPIGGYGLLVNFGNQSQSPIPPPNTLVPAQPDQGGGLDNAVESAGSLSVAASASNGVPSAWMPEFTAVGTLSGWVVDMTMSANSNPPWTPMSGAAIQSANAGSTPLDQGLSNPVTGTAPNDSSVSLLLSSSTSTAPAQSNNMVTIGSAALVLQALDKALDDWGVTHGILSSGHSIDVRTD